MPRHPQKKIYSTDLGIDFKSVREEEIFKDLEKRLLEFKGVGPKTVEIFMRDLKRP